MQQPKISVCIPTYNYGRYLSEAIESVLNQSVTDFELLVVDDSSSDSTDNVMQKYAAQDSRVRYIRHEINQGMVENWNFCLREAHGKYIKFLFGDDFFTSTQTLDKMLTAMESDESISLVGASRIIVDKNSIQTDLRRYGSKSFIENGLNVINMCLLCRQNLIGEPTAVMFKKSQSIRGFDTKYKQIVDLEMWFYLLEQGKFAFLNEPLCAFRVHNEQQTAKNAKQNTLLVDTSHLYNCYLRKHYINLNWFNMHYLEYNYTYKVWKTYFKKDSDLKCICKIINDYGSIKFYSYLLPYKIYNLLVKLIKYLKSFCKLLINPNKHIEQKH